MVKRIRLTKNKTTLVDEKNSHLNQHKWFCDNEGYAVRTCNKTNQKIRMHREILNLTQSTDHVDHVNGDKLDNRECNLRRCSSTDNSKNQKLIKNNKTSKYKGVHLHKSGKWFAQIALNYKKIYLGLFCNEEEAAAAYDAAARIYHKDFESSNESIKNKETLNYDDFEILPRASTVSEHKTWTVVRDDGVVYNSIGEAAMSLAVKPNTITKACTDKERIRKVRGYLLKYGESTTKTTIY